MHAVPRCLSSSSPVPAHAGSMHAGSTASSSRTCSCGRHCGRCSGCCQQQCPVSRRRKSRRGRSNSGYVKYLRCTRQRSVQHATCFRPPIDLPDCSRTCQSPSPAARYPSTCRKPYTPAAAAESQQEAIVLPSDNNTSAAVKHPQQPRPAAARRPAATAQRRRGDHIGSAALTPARGVTPKLAMGMTLKPAAAAKSRQEVAAAAAWNAAPAMGHGAGRCRGPRRGPPRRAAWQLPPLEGAARCLRAMCKA